MVPPPMFRSPSKALTQTQTIEGSISHVPSARTPPQGPFLRFLGQFIGQDMPVDDSTHVPHMRQSNMAFLIARSTVGDRPFQPFMADQANQGLDCVEDTLEDGIESGKAAGMTHGPVSDGLH